MIDISWWLSHLAWFAFGGVVGFAIASWMAVSSEVRWLEETQPVPLDDSAEIAALKAELEEERANVKFYYDMATERM